MLFCRNYFSDIFPFSNNPILYRWGYFIIKQSHYRERRPVILDLSEGRA
ncbi:hypothetical protein SAMN03159284_00540 [Mucilaginibacter sp. NFR10]|jgi:hypothetical protein|nr:hypothetical protein SAMN03159284_00540 [Mucilaginibacter sp. NFR10]